MRSLLTWVVAFGLVGLPVTAWADDQPKVMQSPPLLISGIVLATVGSVALPFGVAVLGTRQPAMMMDCLGCPGPDNTTRDMIGGTMVVAGLGALVASVPMIIFGARRIPLDVAPGGPLGSTGLTLRVRF
jgi:hypothetical protein